MKSSGGFRLDFKIAADYEWMVRLFLGQRLSFVYLSRVLVRMRAGGRSNGSLGAIVRANLECVRAWKLAGRTNPLVFFTKPIAKLSQFIAAKYLRHRGLLRG